MITLSWQNIITAAAVITAVVTILGRYNKLYDFIKRQEEQDKEIKNTQEQILEIQKEQEVLTYGILACLKGLKEQGCNGPVSEAIQKIETHLNEKAHGG